MDITKFRTIDWLEDAEYQTKAQRARSNAKQGFNVFIYTCKSWLILGVSGAIIGAIAVVLTLSTGWLADLRDGHCSSSWYLSESTCCIGQTHKCAAWIPHHRSVAFLIYVVLALVFALVASFIVGAAAPLAAGSGISEIKCIIQGFVAPQYLDRLVLIVKCVTLPLVIASGLSVGKEGPSVHYAACVSCLFPHRAKKDMKYRSDLLIACCASGVAVAFGSPVSGLIFGIEEMATHIDIITISRTFLTCFVATSVVSIFNPFKTGQLVLFNVQYDENWYAFEIPFLIILGVFGGLVGRFIIKYNTRVSALRKKYWGSHYLAEAALLSLLTAVVCYFNSFLKIDMTKSMQILFHECDHGGESHSSCDISNATGILLSLGTAFCIRLFLLLISYGAAKVPAGIFVPSLAIGALFGRFIGTLVLLLYNRFPGSSYFAACKAGNNCVNPGAYALLGAGALLSGVMNITLTVVIVIFELTGVVHHILPHMFVIIVTKIVISQLGNAGIAEVVITQNGYPFLESNPPAHLETMEISQVMVPFNQCEVVREGAAISRDGPHYRTYPVLDSKDRLVGSMSGFKVDRSPIVTHPTNKLDFVYTLFQKLGPHTVFVVDEDKFCGLLTRKGIINASVHNKEMFSDFEERLGSRIAYSLNWIESLCARVGKKLTNK